MRAISFVFYIFLIICLSNLCLNTLGMKNKPKNKCECDCKNSDDGKTHLIAIEKIVKVPRIMVVGEEENDLNFEDNKGWHSNVAVLVNPNQVDYSQFSW